MSHPDGATGTLRARYLVGTDGASSTVRQSLGMPFSGKSAIRSVMLADVLLERAPDEAFNFASNEHGFTFFAPFGDGWYRVIAWDRQQQQLPDDAPVAVEEVQDITRRTIGDDLGMHWLRSRLRAAFTHDFGRRPERGGVRIVRAFRQHRMRQSASGSLAQQHGDAASPGAL
ncbi:FAD-dependent monooxygenase [Streptomyces sp. NPDC001312]|uniref:FAD-dependent monooxygenase n=1 Tax=Streptomyces sp. NPDC001312 TaxID=3364561 RepID=UPI0036ACF524